MNKIYTFLTLLFTINFIVNVNTVNAQCSVSAPADASIACGGTHSLAANTTAVTYSMVASTCPPVVITGANAFVVACDDCVSGEIAIGFPFNFYGNVYNTCAIQSNGIVGFGGLTYTGFSGFAIPASGNPNNYIAGLYSDIDIRCGGTITYQTVGTAPNRQFVVSYDNVVPYGSGFPACSGTGTASFQIVLNENGSFQTSISQLSAGWMSSWGGEITQGAENSNGTYAFPTPGRNDQDIAGIGPGASDCYIFNPGVCVFQRWESGGSTVSTNPNYNVNPLTTTTYTGVWDCAGYTCSDDVVVNVTGPTMATSGITNNTNCATANGAFNLTMNNFANATYTLNYTLNGTAQTQSVTITSTSQVVSFTGLSAGTYNNFSVTAGCNSASLTSSTVINNSFVTPIVTVTNIVNSTSCTTPNGTFDINVSGLSAGTHTVSYLANGSAATANVTVGASTNVSQGTAFNAANIDLSDPTYVRSVSGSSYISSSTVNYETFTFVPSTTGSYVFSNTYGGDAHASMYSSSFNPASPSTNFMNADDDSNGGSDPRITVSLTAGQTYVLVTSTFSSGSTGAFSWTYSGPGGATIATSGGSTASVTVTGLAMGAYTNFTVGTGCNTYTLAGPINISGPSAPTTTGANICLSASGTMSSSSTCTAGSPTTQAASGSGGTSNNASYGGGGNTNITVVFPALPGGATVTATNVTITYSATSPSYRSELRVEATPPSGSLQNDLQPSTLTSSGAVTAANLGTWGTANPVGNWLFRFRETTNDGTPNPDASISNITVTVTYTLPSTLEWYTGASGGTAIGTGTPFDPVGVAGSGLANTNTAGTTTYYAACSASSSCRTPTTFVINPASTPATSVSGTGTVCVGTTVNLGVVGGALASGSNWEWFSGSCTGTAIGTGATLSITPTATTDYYVRATGVGSCPATTCVNGTITLPTQGTTLGNNNESATCPVNQNGYIHFYHSSGRLLASVNSLGQNLGNVTVTSYVSGSPIDVYGCSDPGYKSAMGRRFVITPQFQPATPVDILLHYDLAEFNALVTQANGNSSTVDNLSVIGDLKLSKYSGPLNVDGNFANNCAGAGGSGGTTLHTQTTSGNSSSIVSGFGASGRYTRYSIPGFSEMWLHGVNNNVALPITLSSFYGTCDGNKIKLDWRTESETNSQKFIIEKMRSQEEWISIGEIPSFGNSTEIKEYSIVDKNSSVGNNYYRIKQVDFDGKTTLYNTINVTCGNLENKLQIYPNPNSGEFTVEIQSLENVKDANLIITDITGKVVFQQTLNLITGSILLPMRLEEISSGTYMVNISSDQGSFNPSILIKK